MPACLEEPPTYSEPNQVAPFIITSWVTPELTAVLPMTVGGAQDFVVPFRSVDAGEELEGNLYLDREPGRSGAWRGTSPVAASEEGFEAVRTARASFTPPSNLPPGCHSLTFILAHRSLWFNQDDLNGNGQIRLPSDESRAASVTWWIDLSGDSEMPRECPELGETPQ